MSYTIREAGARKKGLKMLVWGESGVGKSVFSLSFPNSLVLDSEDGIGWYEGTEYGKNIKGVVDTQSFNDLDDVINDMIKGRLPEGIETLIIDSETKFYENIVEALMKIEEKRAARNGRDVLDANLSQRSWGQIKNKAKALQNLKIQLASKGINVVSVAQSKDVLTDMGNGNRVKTGETPNMQKLTEFDYDVNIQLTVENGKRYAHVLKDRTYSPYDQGDKIENPSYDNWKDALTSKQDRGESVEKNFGDSVKESETAYRKELDKNLSFKEKVSNYYMDLSAEERAEFMKKVEKTTGQKDFKEMDAATQEKVLELMYE